MPIALKRGTTRITLSYLFYTYFQDIKGYICHPCNSPATPYYSKLKCGTDGATPLFFCHNGVVPIVRYINRIVGCRDILQLTFFH